MEATSWETNWVFVECAWLFGSTWSFECSAIQKCVAAFSVLVMIKIIVALEREWFDWWDVCLPSANQTYLKSFHRLSQRSMISTCLMLMVLGMLNSWEDFVLYPGVFSARGVKEIWHYFPDWSHSTDIWGLPSSWGNFTLIHHTVLFVCLNLTLMILICKWKKP